MNVRRDDTAHDSPSGVKCVVVDCGNIPSRVHMCRSYFGTCSRTPSHGSNMLLSLRARAGLSISGSLHSYKTVTQHFSQHYGYVSA